MAVISMKQLLEAGVHFGHQTRRWNPKMDRYIFTERNGIYIIDLQKTVKKVEEAYNFVKSVAGDNGTILFVGTKKQAQGDCRGSSWRRNRRRQSGESTSLPDRHGNASPRLSRRIFRKLPFLELHHGCSTYFLNHQS